MGDVKYFVNKNDCLTKVWGNNHHVEQDYNFVRYYFYDSTERLERTVDFYLGYDSLENFVITKEDSVDRSESVYQWFVESESYKVTYYGSIYEDTVYIGFGKMNEVIHKGRPISNINKRGSICYEGYLNNENRVDEF